MVDNLIELPPYLETDSAIRPQDDLYGHACSRWLKNNPRPRSKSSWTITAKLLSETESRLEDILKDWLIADTQTLPEDQVKVVQYYRNLLNRYRYTRNSLESLKKIKKQIYAIKDKDPTIAKAKILALGHNLSLEVFISVEAAIDSANAQRYIPSITTINGHGSFYAGEDDYARQGRRVYLSYLNKHKQLLADLGLKYNISPQKILEIELQTISLDRSSTETGEPDRANETFSFQKFKNRFDFRWDIFFQSLGLELPRTIYVEKVDVLSKFLDYINQLTPSQLKAYLFFQICLKKGGYVSKALDRAGFEYFDKYRLGIKKQASLKKRSFLETNWMFADIFGREYVRHHFPLKHKRAVSAIAKDVKQAFATKLQHNTWLSNKSKAYALAKLENILINVGYSGQWLNYDSINVPKGQVINASMPTFLWDEADLNLRLSLLGQQPKRNKLDDLADNVQEVNAHANRQLLSINCKAAFLQKPLWDYQASWVYNLAMTGITIAHELTHHFDGRGMLFDKEGNLNAWLTKTERAEFRNRLEKLIGLADQHQPLDGHNLDGRLIISELVADLGGLEIVLQAVKNRFQPGSTRDQALKNALVVYGYFYASNNSEEDLLYQIKQSYHPTPLFRTNGVVCHCPDFYRVFNVQPTDKLYLKPADRVQVW